MNMTPGSPIRLDVQAFQPGDRNRHRLDIGSVREAIIFDRERKLGLSVLRAGAEEARFDDRGVDAERLDLDRSDSIQPSRPNFDAE